MKKLILILALILNLVPYYDINTGSLKIIGVIMAGEGDGTVKIIKCLCRESGVESHELYKCPCANKEEEDNVYECPCCTGSSCGTEWCYTYKCHPRECGSSGSCPCCGGNKCTGGVCSITGDFWTDCESDPPCECCGGTECLDGWCNTYSCSTENCTSEQCPCCGNYSCGYGYCQNTGQQQSDCEEEDDECDCCLLTSCSNPNNCGGPYCTGGDPTHYCICGHADCWVNHTSCTTYCNCGHANCPTTHATCSPPPPVNPPPTTNEEPPLPNTEKFKIPEGVKDSCLDKSKDNATKVNSLFKRPEIKKQIDTLLMASSIEKAVNLLVNDAGNHKAGVIRTDSSKYKVTMPTPQIPIKDSITKIWYRPYKDIATFHNHPDGGPPSITDLYGFLEVNTHTYIKFDPKRPKQPQIDMSAYDTDFVVGNDTSMFAFHVENRSNTLQFWQEPSFSEDSTINPTSTLTHKIDYSSKMGKEFQKATLFYSNELKFDSKQAYAWAFAHILRYSNSGVKLLVRDQNGNFCELNTFQQKESIQKPDGTIETKDVFVATICK